MKGYVLSVALNAAVDVAYQVPRFAVGGISVASGVQKVAGGKANNVARVLARLGQPVLATGFAGGDSGRFILADLAAAGVATDYVEVSGSSRVCMAITDPVSGMVTELREPGPMLAEADLARFATRFERLLGNAAYVVLSGSLPPGVPATCYHDLIRLAQHQGVPTLLDTSGPALQAAVSACPLLVKPNRDELAHWVGEPLPDLAAVLDAARRLLAAGPAQVVVSLGAEGLLLVTAEGAWQALPPAVVARNTVGCGDSSVAGLVAGLLQRLAPAEMLRLAAACGTANALTDGVAEVRPADVVAIAPQVRGVWR